MTTTHSSPRPPRRRALLGLLAGGAALATFIALQGHAQSFGGAEPAVAIAPPALDETTTARTETAVFAGGCFWGVQGVFQHVRGVLRAVSGYAGGSADTAQYETVSSGTTGHAESVQVTFDPSQVSYGALLQIFFSVAHDPTELNRQGPDSGTQYRSAIFPADAEQERVARAYIAQLDAAHAYARPIVTRIEDKARFYPAEAYHQDFLARHPSYPYIAITTCPSSASSSAFSPTAGGTIRSWWAAPTEEFRNARGRADRRLRGPGVHSRTHTLLSQDKVYASSQGMTPVLET